MENSCCLTENDMQLINLAFRRKIDSYRRHVYGFELPSFLDGTLRYGNDDPTVSFISQSLHHYPESLQVRGVSKFHDSEFYLLTTELERCEETVLRQCNGSTLPKATHNSDETYDQASLSLLRRFLCLHDERRLMSTSLKNILKRIDPPRQLLWIITLLIDFHYGNECSMFLSVAIKLCLKASELLLISSSSVDRFTYDFEYLATHKLCKYLQMMQRNQCQDHLFSVAMEVFSVHPEMRAYFFERVHDLKFHLQVLKRNNFEMSSLLNAYEPGSLRSYDICLAVSHQNFVALVELGAFSVYSNEDWDIMKWRGIRRCDRNVLNKDTLIPVFGRFRLRLGQTIRLFQKSISNKPHSYSEAVFVLKLLWASIPDPFLTEEEIKECISEPVKEMSVFPKKVYLRNRPQRNSTRLCDLDRFSKERLLDFSQFYHLFHTLKECPDSAFSEYLHRTAIDISRNTVHNTICPSLGGTPSATTISQAWQWYKEIILQRESLVKSPRSLQHLSRCTIRQCLAMNFQLPAGIHFLNLPVAVINYLLLKDCGDNPFESESFVMEKLLRLHTFSF